MKNKLKILFASYECAPFFKLGGLADVALGLPKELKRQGVDVRVIIPLYPGIKRDKFKIKKYLTFKFLNYKIDVYKSRLPRSRAVIYFIKSKKYFDRQKVFGYRDDKERFVFFSRAVLEFLKAAKWQPHVIQANDWHTGAIPLFLRQLRKKDLFYKNIKTLFTIHNLGYQGVFGEKELQKMSRLELSRQSLKYKKQFNLMAEGILQSDMVNTVSRTYAQEILTAEYGAGLENILRKRKKDLYGVINGLDTNFFNPARDQALKYRFNKKNVLKRKPLNKEYLQKICGLPLDKNIPVFGLVSRLARQKGIHLITENIDALAKLNAQFIFLGSGEKEIEESLKRAQKKYPQKFYALTGVFAAEFGRQIYAGSDFFLMPSRYEPCGLGQMIAMRYGAIPIVRATGGLKDTVRPINIKNDTGNGFLFKEFNSEAFFKVIKKAISVYNNKKYRQKIIKRTIREDWSWRKPAGEYLALYNQALKKK